MMCRQCNTILIEIARFDGDKMISTRLCCPFCGNGIFDVAREDSEAGDTEPPEARFALAR